MSQLGWISDRDEPSRVVSCRTARERNAPHQLEYGRDSHRYGRLARSSRSYARLGDERARERVAASLIGSAGRGKFSHYNAIDLELEHHCWARQSIVAEETQETDPFSTHELMRFFSRDSCRFLHSPFTCRQLRQLPRSRSTSGCWYTSCAFAVRAIYDIGTTRT